MRNDPLSRKQGFNPGRWREQFTPAVILASPLAGASKDILVRPAGRAGENPYRKILRLAVLAQDDNGGGVRPASPRQSRNPTFCETESVTRGLLSSCCPSRPSCSIPRRRKKILCKKTTSDAARQCTFSKKKPLAFSGLARFSGIRAGKNSPFSGHWRGRDRTLTSGHRTVTLGGNEFFAFVLAHALHRGPQAGKRGP